MTLSSVTVTGADDAVDPRALAALSREFPFVEWGILVSASRVGTPRYPTRRWMLHMEGVAEEAHRSGHPVRLAAHFCGQVAREALTGRRHDLPVVERVQRVQLNGYAPRSAGAVAFAGRMPGYEVVLQVRDEESLQLAANAEVRSLRERLAAAQKNVFYVGVSVALSGLRSWHYDDAVRHVAGECGLTVEVARECGVSEYDWSYLRRCGVPDR